MSFTTEPAVAIAYGGGASFTSTGATGIPGTLGGGAPVITVQPSTQTVNSGSNVTFSVTATGTAPLTYQWKKGGVNISGATSSSYTITGVAGGDAGSYTCAVTNAGGTTTSNAGVLTVNTVYSMYWGRSASTGGLNEAAVLALPASGGSSDTAATNINRGGAGYAFGSGSGYWYLWIETAAGNPGATPSAGFFAGAFPWATAPDPYGSGAINGWRFEAVTVNGKAGRLFRSENTLGGGGTVTVTT